MVNEQKKPEMKVENKVVETRKDFASLDNKEKNEPAKSFEKKTEDKKEEVKVVAVAPKKDKAIARGLDLRISPKYSIFVCRAIMRKSPEDAIKRLEDVIKMKRAIPMRSLEVPHRKGPGMAGGRYPKKVCIEMINLLKQVNANATVSGIENPVITIARADKSQGPFRRGGTRGKRAHILIEVMSKTKLVGNKK